MKPLFNGSALLLLLCGLLLLSTVRAGEDVPATDRLSELRVANVRDFGAVGDGKADDTVAIEKAWAFATDTRKPQFQDQWAIGVNVVLYFPQGIYRYAGNGLQVFSGENGRWSAQIWEIRGDGVNASRIDLAKDVYLLNLNRIQSTTIRDLSFNGGKGVFKSAHTGNMVGGNHLFQNCYFFNYSECAIGNNANDAPYLMVDGCIFHCRKGADAIGIAWGGDIADSYIARSHFEQNAYHIKLGDHLGNAFQVGPRNLFLSFGGTRTKADIWIVPNRKSAINSGQGALISENKFGNENVDPACPRILLSEEDPASGTDRLTRRPSQELCGDNAYIQGIKLKDNVFAGGGSPQRGLVYSRLRNAAIVFDHNQYFGSTYPWLIEFDARFERLPDNARSGRGRVYPQEGFSGRLCNLPGYAVLRDDSGFGSGAGEGISSGERNDDPAFTPFIALTGKDLPVSGKAAVAPVADARGNPTAATVEIENAVSGLEVPFANPAALREGQSAYLDVELRAAPERSLELVHLAVLNYHNGKPSAGRITDEQRVFSRSVMLQPYWQRVTLPFVVRDARSGDFRLAIRLLGWYGNEMEKGTKDRFEVGNVRVYHAKAPVGLNRDGVRVITDCDLTFTPGVDPQQLVFTGTLTGERTIDFTPELPTLRPLPGMRLHVSRPAGGEAPLKIGTAATLAAGQWCELVFTGKEFSLVARGSL